MFKWFKRNKWNVTVGTLVVVLAMVATGILPGIPLKVGKTTVNLGEVQVVEAAGGTLDYYFTGVNDNTQFNAAIAALPATGGELTILSPAVGQSTINFSGTVTVPANVSIIGAGTGTSINYAGGACFASTNSSDYFSDLKVSTAGGGISGTFTGSNLYIGTTYYAVYGGGTVTATTLNAPTGRTATYVIAASDATATEKAQADYVCDGTADDVQIQAAIDLLNAAGGGGSIKLSEGTFNIVTPLSITKSLSFEGTSLGWNHTIRGTKILPTTAGIIVTGTNNLLVSFSNIYIYGGSGNGIQINQAMWYIDDCQIEGCGGEGLDVNGSWVGELSNSDILGCTGYGADFGKDSAVLSTDILVLHTHFGNNGTYDIYTDTCDVRILGGYFEHYGSSETFIKSVSTTLMVADTTFYGVNAAADLVVANGPSININSSSFSGTYSKGISIDGAGTANINSNYFMGSANYDVYCVAGIYAINVDNNNFLDVTSQAVYINASGGGGHVSVTNNTIASTGTGTSDDAIHIQEVASTGSVVVNGNSVYGAMGNGIEIATDTNVGVSGNVIVSCAAFGIRIRDSSLFNVTGNTVINNADVGIRIWPDASNGYIQGNKVSGNTNGNIFDQGTGNTILANMGYLASGEVRTISGTITGTASDNAALMLSIDNPFGQAVRVTDVQVEITVNASAAATMDAGIGSSATADYTTMIAALPINPGTTYPYYYSAVRTATYGQMAAVPSINWTTGAGNRYLNFFNPSVNASGTVFRATYTITVMGN